MRKGVTRKPQSDEPATPVKNYITRSGLQRLKDEHRFLLTRERPAVTEVVAWAASNSEAPGFVRSSTDNGTFDLPSYNDGLAAQVRVVPLLDRSIKRVHVDVDDFAHNSLVTILVPAEGHL